MPAVGSDRAATALVLFTVLLAIGSIVVSVHEFSKSDQPFLASLTAVGRTLGSITVFCAAVTVILVEGIMVFIEGYLKRRYEKGQEKGQEKEREAWEAWDARRRAAIAAGLDFTEPTPSERERARAGTT